MMDFDYTAGFSQQRDAPTAVKAMDRDEGKEKLAHAKHGIPKE